MSFKDGTEIPADLVVMAAGVEHNIQLAKESGIKTNRRSWSMIIWKQYTDILRSVNVERNGLSI